MATNKKTVSVYADDDLLTALEQFKDSGNHKSLNVAIVAILREKLFGEASGNVQSNLQSNVSSTLDIEAMIAAAIEKQSTAPDVDIESIVNEAIAKQLDDRDRVINIAIGSLRESIEALAVNTRNEATAPANFTSALLQKAKAIAPLKLMQAS